MAWWPSGSCTSANRDSSSRRTIKQGNESSKGEVIWRARLPNAAASAILSPVKRARQDAASFLNTAQEQIIAGRRMQAGLALVGSRRLDLCCLPDSRWVYLS